MQKARLPHSGALLLSGSLAAAVHVRRFRKKWKIATEQKHPLRHGNAHTARLRSRIMRTGREAVD